MTGMLQREPVTEDKCPKKNSLSETECNLNMNVQDMIIEDDCPKNWNVLL